MLIAGFLREDFIKQSFKLPKTDLEELLVVFKDCDYLIVIKDPDFSLSKIFESLPKNIFQAKIDLWENTLKEVYKKGRYFRKIETKKLIASKPKEQANKKNFKDEELVFYIKSLTGKIWNYSTLKAEEDESLHDIKCFSSSLFTFGPKLLKKVFDNNQKFVLKDKKFSPNLKVNKYDNLFFEKIAGYLCFNDTVIIFDQYIYEPCLDSKGNPSKKSILRLSEYLAKSPNLKNIIVLGQDWWNKFNEGEPFLSQEKKKTISKKKCISILLNSIKDSLGKKREEISINFYLIPSSIFKNEHERFIIFTNLGEKFENLDLGLLSTLENFVSIKFDQGIDYFNDNPIKNAKIEYSSTKDFVSLKNELINFNINTFSDIKFKKDCKTYWNENYGAINKLWIHHDQILNN